MRPRLGRTRTETTKVYREAIHEMMRLYHRTGFTSIQAHEIAAKYKITRAITNVLLKGGIVEKTSRGYEFISLTLDERKLWKGRREYRRHGKGIFIKRVLDSSGCKTPLEEAIKIVKAAGFKVMKPTTTWQEC